LHLGARDPAVLPAQRRRFEGRVRQRRFRQSSHPLRNRV
jgi:hypothetical protein